MYYNFLKIKDLVRFKKFVEKFEFIRENIPIFLRIEIFLRGYIRFHKKVVRIMRRLIKMKKLIR
jgi:hypothetical protein